MINDKLKEFAQKKYDDSTDDAEQFKYEIILNILKDSMCFQKMKTKDAYKLLLDLGFSTEDSKRIYNEIIFKNVT